MPGVAVWAGMAVILLYVAYAAGVLGRRHLGTTVLALLLTALVVIIAQLIPVDDDRRWLSTLVVGAFGLKLAASGFRYWVLVSWYGGVGDAPGYHNRGLELAPVWRSFEIPDLDFGGAGTTFLAKATGLFYVPYQPTMLGGFFLFAFVAFLGQLLLYAAFRRAIPTRRRFWYAAAVLGLPSLLFWPSSIGKESLMLFFIGVVAYGTARLLTEYRFRWALVAGAGLVGAAGVRVHVAALLAVALGAAVVLGRAPDVRARTERRVLLVAGGIALAALLVAQVGDQLGVTLSGTSDLDPLFSELERRTQQGGSAVEGEPVTNLAALPGAVMRVLFRPLPHEAHNSQAMLSALEGAALLGVVIWRSPRLVRNLRLLRRYPYLIFSLVFTAGFVVAFSTLLNLGILARQRTQVLPFLLVVIVAMGWPIEAQTADEADAEVTLQRPEMGARA
jgi:hypothetical protein